MKTLNIFLLVLLISLFTSCKNAVLALVISQPIIQGIMKKNVYTPMMLIMIFANGNNI